MRISWGPKAPLGGAYVGMSCLIAESLVLLTDLWHYPIMLRYGVVSPSERPERLMPNGARCTRLPKQDSLNRRWLITNEDV